MPSLAKVIHRCGYQCNAAPNEQRKGSKRSKRCKRKNAGVTLMELTDGTYSYRCGAHQRKKYLDNLTELE